MLVGTLRILSESTQQDVLLRILQTLSMVADPATFEAGEDAITQAIGRQALPSHSLCVNTRL